MMKKQTALAATLAFTSAGSVSAGSVYSFEAISNDSLADIAIGEAQFSVEVIDAGTSIEFLFKNAGPEASSMVQLYWEDQSNVLSSLDSWSTTTPSGVVYEINGASPGHLPGSNPKINDFAIDPASGGDGKAPNGVGPLEDVSIFFAYNGVYQDVVDALDTGSLKIGVHGQSFDGGGSESFVHTPGGGGTPIPSPTAALTGLVMFGGLVMRRRRRD